MARKLSDFGPVVKLISPQFVRPFVKKNKNDFVDAEAVCEAASRPSMRFVTPKTESQQTLSVLHHVGQALVRDLVCTTNQMHGFLLELGISLPVGHAVVKRLSLVLTEQISDIKKELQRQLSDDAVGQRSLTIPSVGLITASLLASELGDGKQYRCSRDFAAAVGLCQGNTVPAVGRPCSGFLSEAARISATYWSSVPRHSCFGQTNRQVASQIGHGRCSHGDIPAWLRGRWPVALARIAWAIVSHKRYLKTRGPSPLRDRPLLKFQRVNPSCFATPDTWPANRPGGYPERLTSF